jgi:hypothetical protein
MDRKLSSAGRSRLLRVGAVVGLAVVAGVATWILVARGDDHPAQAAGASAQAVSVAELSELPGQVGHAVYWAGSRPGMQYELTRTADGRVYVRYLPSGVEAGDASSRFLTVGTYPVADALARTKAAGARPGAEQFALRGGGVAIFDRSRPTNVYFAYPGTALQVEVYDPSARTARRLVESGAVQPIAAVAPAGEAARTVSLAELRRLPAFVGHPVYWAGPHTGQRYELTRTEDGNVYIRYLPDGVQAGDRRADFLTVATYPRADALAATRGAGQQSGGVRLSLPGGGVAVFSRDRPTNVYLAYPRVPFQVEVFDPSAGTARELVETGRVVPIR